MGRRALPIKDLSNAGLNPGRLKVTLTLPRDLIARVDEQATDAAKNRSAVVEEAVSDWVNAPGHFTAQMTNNFFANYLSSDRPKGPMVVSAVHGRNLFGLFESLSTRQRQRVTQLRVNCMPAAAARTLSELEMLPKNLWSTLVSNLRQIEDWVKVVVIQPQKPLLLHGVFWGDIGFFQYYNVVNSGEMYEGFEVNKPVLGIDPRLLRKLDRRKSDQERKFDTYVKLFNAGTECSVTQLGKMNIDRD